MAVRSASPLHLDSSACTAPPHPATMTRFALPGSSTAPSPSPSSANRWFQRTNALLSDGDDCACSETDCLPARAASLLSAGPQIAPEVQRPQETESPTWDSQRGNGGESRRPRPS